MPIEIVHTSDKAEADRLALAGYEPVECSFGRFGSVLGPLAMDHHGEESAREGVALRAYRDHFGARKGDPRFVVTGAADADATFAIAALCGLLPHPVLDAEFDERTPPSVRAANTRDVGVLAALVNRVDVAPIGVRLEETEEGVTLLLWNQLSSSAQDAVAFFAGVDRWRALVAGRPLKALLAAAKDEEASRVAEARKAEVERISSSVAIVESPVWGFDVWYAEITPVIVAYVRGADGGHATIGCRDVAVAETFFGPGGLKNVFSKLHPQGWGGREAIGGSPRGAKLSREEVVEAAKIIDAAITMGA